MTYATRDIVVIVLEQCSRECHVRQWSSNIDKTKTAIQEHLYSSIVYVSREWYTTIFGPTENGSHLEYAVIEVDYKSLQHCFDIRIN